MSRVVKMKRNTQYNYVKLFLTCCVYMQLHMCKFVLIVMKQHDVFSEEPIIKVIGLFHLCDKCRYTWCISKKKTQKISFFFLLAKDKPTPDKELARRALTSHSMAAIRPIS